MIYTLRLIIMIRFSIWLDQPLPFISAVRGVFAGWPKNDSVTASPESDDEEHLRREALLESKL
jgi:hypothetical protein